MSFLFIYGLALLSPLEQGLRLEEYGFTHGFVWPSLFLKNKDEGSP